MSESNQNDRFEESHRIDRLSSRLYSADPARVPKHREGVLHQIVRPAITAWKEPEKIIEKVDTMATNTNMFKRFFIGASVFFLLAIGVALTIFFMGGNTVSSDNINLNILGNAYTSGGEPLSLTVEMENKNTTALELVDLIVEYSKSGTTLAGATDISRTRMSVGDIGIGKAVQKDVALTLFGEENSTKQIHFRLEYHVAGSNAIFQKEKDFTVTISSSPITLSVDGATTAVSGQPYTFTVHVVPNGTKTISNMLLRVEYPTGFQFTSADPSPSYLSSIFTLGDVAPGSPKDIKITGTILGQDKETRSLRIYVGTASSSIGQEITTVFNSVLHTVTIARPFLEAHMTVNGSTLDEIPVSGRQDVTVEIQWANNLPVRILNGQIALKLTGGLLDKTSILPIQGFYRSSDDTVLWSKDTLPILQSIDPGATGVVEVSFKTYGLFNRDGSVAQNPSVNLNLAISGAEPSAGGFSQMVGGTETKTLKLKTDFQVTAATLFKSGPTINTGPFPPRVDQKTTYTVKWALTNTANDITNATVRASLPTYVRFIGGVSPSGESVSLDPSTGQVVWAAGVVSRGSGFTTPAKTVYFQIELEPSLSQVGTIPTLLLDTTATGEDSYTKNTLSTKASGVTTHVLDVNYDGSSDKVVE